MTYPAIHPNPAMYISPEMIQELAIGTTPPLDVAARYGITALDFGVLQGQSWFAEMVVRRRMELDAEGQTFMAKGKMMMEELYTHLYQSAITGGLTPQLVLEFTKQLGEVTGVKVKANAVQSGPAGPAFQININLNPEAATPPGPRPIEGQAKTVKPVIISIPKDDLPPRPEGFRVPDFKLTPDLVGTPSAVTAAQQVGARP